MQTDMRAIAHDVDSYRCARAAAADAADRPVIPQPVHTVTRPAVPWRPGVSSVQSIAACWHQAVTEPDVQRPPCPARRRGRRRRRRRFIAMRPAGERRPMPRPLLPTDSDALARATAARPPAGPVRSIDPSESRIPCPVGPSIRT